MQLIFGDAEYNAKHKRPSPEVFSANRDCLLRSKALSLLIARGAMQRMHVLQYGYLSSKPAAEDGSFAVVSMRRAGKRAAVDHLVRCLRVLHDLLSTPFDWLKTHRERPPRIIKRAFVYRNMRCCATAKYGCGCWP